MDKITIITKINVTKENIANLLVDAFDPQCNAVGYWAEISGDKKPEKMEFQSFPEQIYRYCDYPLNEGGEIYLKNIEADKGETYVLGLKEITKGLEIMAEKYPKHWADFMQDNDDAITADVFIQCCIFGEVVYG